MGSARQSAACIKTSKTPLKSYIARLTVASVPEELIATGPIFNISLQKVMVLKVTNEYFPRAFLPPEAISFIFMSKIEGCRTHKFLGSKVAKIENPSCFWKKIRYTLILLIKMNRISVDVSFCQKHTTFCYRAGFFCVARN